MAIYKSVSEIRALTSGFLTRGRVWADKFGRISEPRLLTQTARDEILKGIPKYFRRHAGSVNIEEDQLEQELSELIALALEIRGRSGRRYPEGGRVGVRDVRIAMGRTKCKYLWLC
jgi:hypothetical protein